MNYNMMYKVKYSLLLLICILCMPLTPAYASDVPSNEAELRGDILIVYSDAASDEEIKAVSDMVEILTYQAFQVAFAEASDSMDMIEQYDYIICYHMERYPEEIIPLLQSCRETEILFIGNTFMKDYMDTGNKSVGRDYIESSVNVGKIIYFFDELSSKEGLSNEDEFVFLEGKLDYQSGTLLVDDIEGYVVASKGNITHMALSDMNDALVKAIFSREVAVWKWPYSGTPHVYAQYIVLNEVYPFVEPEKLLSVVELMVDAHEPFVISVMPVYLNGEYPAMQRFCEILRYAQDNGGTIIIHAPINQDTKIDADTMNAYLTMATNYYLAQGVYPMALQAPSVWMYDENAMKVIGRFSTIFATDEEDPLVEFPADVHTNKVYKDGHQWVGPAIALDATGVSYTKVYSTAVYIDISEDVDTITNKINACRQSFVPLKSLWDIAHSFWTDEAVMNYKNKIILVNGERVEYTFEPTEFEEDYDYHRNMLKRFSKDLSSENSKLLVAVIIVSTLFIFFILVARYNNRRKFFHSKDKE